MIQYLNRRLIEVSSVRSYVWRIGRRLYCLARRDYANDPKSNGEYWLLEKILSACQGEKNIVFLDIGANIGEWSKRALMGFKTHSISGQLVAFEPARATFESLSTRFAHERQIMCKNIALSSSSRESDFHVIKPLAGINSLHPQEGASIEKVQCKTLDEILVEEGISHVTFAKCDTEGHDMKVLIGSEHALNDGRIDCFQFEYNHRWILSRNFLRDVFDFVSDKPYSLGKLYGCGIELYDHWHPELERFFETNFILLRRNSDIERLSCRAYFDVHNVATSL